jgi:multiple sugar transport system substrate-binding protein
MDQSGQGEIMTRIRTSRRAVLLGIAGTGTAAIGAPGIVSAQGSRPAPFTIVINQSPWFDGFRRTVEAYQRDTGNRVTLDVNPFAGSLEKQRNSVRARQGQFDLLIMNGLFYQEFYHGGFVTPINDIDPGFQLDPQIITYDNTVWWDAAAKAHRPNSKLMAIPVNGNVPLLYYRADLYQQRGLQVPDTWDQLLANAKALHNPATIYGMVQRGARGPADVSYDWFPYFNSFNGNLFRDEPNGDFTVTINSPEGKAALDFYLQLAREAGHPQTGGLAQGQVIQNIVTGRAAHAIIVIAAWSQMDDPQRSAVVDKINVARVPRAANGRPAPTLGHWLAGVSHNVPDDRKQAAIVFLKWFQTRQAQVTYVEAGSPPVRQDVLTDQTLASQPRYRWMRAMAESSPHARMMWTIPEGAQIVAVLELRLNQAVTGEMTSAAALNAMAEEVHQIVRQAGYRTGRIANL